MHAVFLKETIYMLYLSNELYTDIDRYHRIIFHNGIISFSLLRGWSTMN